MKKNLIILFLRCGLAYRQGDSDFFEPARALYHLLIKPVAAALVEIEPRTLLVSLDGALRYLPFSVLHDGSSFLIQKYAVVVLAGAARHPIQGHEIQNRRIAAFGMSKEAAGLRALPHVRDEIKSIVELDAQKILTATALLDDEFTEESLAAALTDRPTVLHIASHFVFVPAQQQESWLLLGSGDALTLERLANDLFRFDGINLAVLTACEVRHGAGPDRNGEEIEGLGALLLNRGVNSVLASLWHIDDFSTAVLMRNFYRMWQSEGLSKAEALRQAQLSFLGKAESASTNPRGLVEPDESEACVSTPLSHPYFWAPLLLFDRVIMPGLTTTCA